MNYIYEEILEDNFTITKSVDNVEIAMDNLIALHGLKTIINDSKDTNEIKRLSLHTLESSKYFLGEEQSLELKMSLEDYDTLSMEGVVSAIGNFITKIFDTVIKIIVYIYKAIKKLIKKILVFLGLMDKDKKKKEEKIKEIVKETGGKENIKITEKDLVFIDENFRARLLGNNDIIALMKRPNVDSKKTKNILITIMELLSDLYANIVSGEYNDVTTKFREFDDMSHAKEDVKKAINDRIKGLRKIHIDDIHLYEMYSYKKTTKVFVIAKFTDNKFTYRNMVIPANISKKVTSVKSVTMSGILDVYTKEFKTYGKSLTKDLENDLGTWEEKITVFLKESKKKLENNNDKKNDTYVKEILQTVKEVSVTSTKMIQELYVAPVKEEKMIMNLFDKVFLKTDTTNVDPERKARFEKRQADKKENKNYIGSEITPYDIM